MIGCNLLVFLDLKFCDLCFRWKVIIEKAPLVVLIFAWRFNGVRNIICEDLRKIEPLGKCSVSPEERFDNCDGEVFINYCPFL